LSVDAVSEAEVRLNMKREEASEAAKHKSSLQKTSPVSFLTMGLELEQAQ
jgi:hypothetical protein